MKNIVMQQWFEKQKKKSGNEAKSYKEMAEKMDHGATALKDGKYLEAKDIANEVLQMKKTMRLKQHQMPKICFKKQKM